MNVSFMQRVDFWVGVPLCWFLSILLFCKRILLPNSTESAPKKVLFIELSEMGSTVLAWPAMAQAQELVGESGELFFLIFESNKESISLLEIIPRANILTIDDSCFWNLSLSTARLLPKLWRLSIDTTIDLELYSRFTALVSLLSGAQRRVGFHNFTEEGLYRGNFLTSRVSYNPFIHISQNFLALVKAVPSSATPPLPKTKALAITPLPPQISFTEQELIAAKNTITQASNQTFQSGKKLILFDADPGQLPLRAWPREYYTTLATKLLERFPEAIIGITGLASASTYLKPLLDSLQDERVFSLIGQTASLRELLAVFAHTNLLVSNDGGPAHFATLTDTPSIVLFGPESPTRYRPLGSHAHAMSAQFHCSPCFSAANHRRSSCTDNQCMSAISIEGVFQKAEEILT